MKKITKQNLEKLANIMPIIPECEMRKLIGGGTGSSDDPYTSIEMENMMNSGSWSGGYVEYLGYVDGGIACFNGDGQYYYSLSEYIRSGIDDSLTQILKLISGSIPGLGNLIDYWDSEYDNARNKTIAELVEMGYNNSSIFYVDSMTEGKVTYLRIYDARNGSLITEREFYPWGSK